MPPIAMCNVKLDNTDQIVRISLQDINSCAETAKTFLKRKFKVQEEPSILYHEDDETMGLIIGEPNFEAKETYIWKFRLDVWKDANKVQNSIYCSLSAYEKTPFHYLSNNSSNHNINEVIVVGKYFHLANEESNSYTRVVMALDGDTMYIAFKGSETISDWKTNLNIRMEEDTAWCGQLHGGFLEKATYVNTTDILEYCMCNSISEIITTGHSQGGAISSLFHLKLVKAFEGYEDILENNKPELFNITFGSPFFGNYVLEEDLKNKGYLENMYHFASTTDIVPAILSIGHIFKIIKEKMGIFSAWLENNKFHLGIFETIEKVAMCWNNTQKYSNEKTSLNEFLLSYDQLMKSLKPSNLYNSYNEINYVPIGKFLLLQKQQNGTHQATLLEDKKLIERIIQAATEYHADNLSTMISEHLLACYLHKIKEHLGGLNQFPKRKLKAYSDDIKIYSFSKSHLHVEPVSRYFCGYDDCQECSRISFYEQNESLVKKLIFCRTCQSNPHILEHYFHKVCSEIFHVDEKKDHLMYPVDLSKIDPNSRHDFLLTTKHYDLEVYQERASKAKHVATFGIQALRTSNAIQKIILAGGEIAESRFMHASWKWNAITSATVFALTTGVNMYKMFSGQITFKKFLSLEIQQAGGALGSFGLGMAGSAVGFKIGAFVAPFTGPLAPGVIIAGGAIGGVIGAITGQMFGEKAFKWIAEEIPWLEEEEDEEKAKVVAFVESMLILDVPVSILNEVDEKDVHRCFRKKALQCHPDRLPVNSNDEDKKIAYTHWYAIEMARDMLLKYCEDPSMLYPSLKKKIQKLYQKSFEEVDRSAYIDRMNDLKEDKAKGSLELKKK